MVEEPPGELGVSAMLALRAPARDRRLGAPAELAVGLVQRAPHFAFALHFEIKDLTQVMAESGNEGCVLPAGAVPGAAKAIDAAVGPTLHDDVALELLQCLQRHLKRMPV